MGAHRGQVRARIPKITYQCRWSPPLGSAYYRDADRWDESAKTTNGDYFAPLETTRGFMIVETNTTTPDAIYQLIDDLKNHLYVIRAADELGYGDLASGRPMNADPDHDYDSWEVRGKMDNEAGSPQETRELAEVCFQSAHIKSDEALVP